MRDNMEKLKKVFIETNVDKLLKIVEERGSITLEECSALLGVPESTIEEWAEILSENNFIEMDYGLKYTFLKAKKLSKKEGNKVIKKVKKEKRKMKKEEKRLLKKIKRIEKKLKVRAKKIEILEKDVNKKIKHIEKDSKYVKSGKEEIKKEIKGIRGKEREITEKMKTIKEKFDKIGKKIKYIGRDSHIDADALEKEIKDVEERIVNLKENGKILEKVVNLLEKRVEEEKPSKIDKLKKFFAGMRSRTKELDKRKGEMKREMKKFKKHVKR